MILMLYEQKEQALKLLRKMKRIVQREEKEEFLSRNDWLDDHRRRKKRKM
jgi:hypothetical protein